jgi:hypothetical protein
MNLEVRDMFQQLIIVQGCMLLRAFETGERKKIWCGFIEVEAFRK